MKISETLSYDRNSGLLHEKNKTTNMSQMKDVLQSRNGRAASVEISDEGRAALREELRKIKSDEEEPNLSDELLTVEDTNEVEMEHYFAMREYSGQTLKDGNYNLEDVMKSMLDAYEARYNELVKAHENGDREAAYDLVGKVSVTFEQDIAGLDRAYQRQMAGIEGYITCQQTTDGAKFFKSTDTPAEAVEKKEYNDTALSMLEKAREQFLEMRKQPDYKEGIGKSIMWSIMSADAGFMQKTQQLFAKTIRA